MHIILDIFVEQINYLTKQLINKNGVWCSGSTSALGAFSLGSIPSTPTIVLIQDTERLVCPGINPGHHGFILWWFRFPVYPPKLDRAKGDTPTSKKSRIHGIFCLVPEDIIYITNPSFSFTSFIFFFARGASFFAP